MKTATGNYFRDNNFSDRILKVEHVISHDLRYHVVKLDPDHNYNDANKQRVITAKDGPCKVKSTESLPFCMSRRPKVFSLRVP